MIITQNGAAKAVIQDPKSYGDIKSGNLHTGEDVFNSIEEFLGTNE